MPVYDRSYRRWDGELQRRAARWVPIGGAGIRNAIGTKRAIIWTVCFYAFLLVSAIPFLLLLFLNYIYHFPPEALATPELRGFMDDLARFKILQYPGFQRLMDLAGFHLIYVVLFGSGLVARDRAAMALPLYLSRPLLIRDYVLGKFSVIAFFLCCITLFPCLFLWLFDVFATDQEGYLADSFSQFPAILVHSGSLVVVYSLTILAASSVCRRPMIAAVAWIGGFVVLRVLITVLDQALGVPNIAAVFPASAAHSIAYELFEIDSLRDDIPGAPELLANFGIRRFASVGWSVLSLLGWSLGSLWLIVRSIRRVDVTSSQGG